MSAGRVSPEVALSRRTSSQYESLLPEFFPLKLIGAFISLDFLVGCSFACRFCISRRHPARRRLFDAGLSFDSRVSPERMLAWLHASASFRAGVQIRVGHDTDAGLEFEKGAELVRRLPPERSVVWLTRRPLSHVERTFFEAARPNLLLKLTATPRSESLGGRAAPLQRVRAGEGIAPETTYWVVGPLVADSIPDAERVLDSLPAGSHLFLKPLNIQGLPELQSMPALDEPSLRKLEERAIARGHVVTEWFCRRSFARVGRAFFDVDRITGQPEGEKRTRELEVCDHCPSRSLCHAELDWPHVLRELERELVFLGLTLVDEPRRLGPHSVELPVAEPSSRGDETYLSHALTQPVRVRLSTRERGASEGGSFCNVDPAVLRRWAEVGFLPVAELNAAAARTVASIQRRLSESADIPGAVLDAPTEEPTC